MDGLRLERVPIRGVPAEFEVAVGRQAALVVPDPAQARRLADLICGLEEPASGTIVAGGPVRLVPAGGGLLPYLTLLENLVHGHCTAHRTTRSAALAECQATAALYGLGDVLHRLPHEVTPGRRRLAGLARAIRAQPAVVVLEDAPGLPTWGASLRYDGNPELLSAALLLITYADERVEGFVRSAPGPTDG